MIKRLILFGAFICIALFTSASAKAQGSNYGEGNFLLRCEAQWERNMPFVGRGVAEDMCEVDWYLVYSEPECNIECEFDMFYTIQVESEGNKYEGSEGGFCLTCQTSKPD